MQPYQINTFNNTCFILPRAKIPNGLHLTYDTCPEHFNNSTLKLNFYLSSNIYDKIFLIISMQKQLRIRRYSQNVKMLMMTKEKILNRLKAATRI